jgi:UDP-N-acetylmuramate--alanine ligase
MGIGTKTTGHFFFIGIAGTGMSAIAQYLKGTGCRVSGSDRLFGEPGTKIEIQSQFEKMGIRCFPQDCSGITEGIDTVVISTAIEESNPELMKTRELGIKVMKRSELLADLSSEKRTIAVGGTSGKSTTTAMIFHILQENQLDPSLMTGAGLTSLIEQGLPGNAWVGSSDWLIIEADESDGSIVNYMPEHSLLLNVEKDHKEYNELMELFSTFKRRTRGKFIVNEDHERTRQLSMDTLLNFGSSPHAGFRFAGFEQEGYSIQFTINDCPVMIPVIGRHNMENAAGAIAVASVAGVRLENSAKALSSFRGIYRRTQLVGEHAGIKVIDDFAHNPHEIASAIKACQSLGSRVIAWYQPHGYGPLKFMRDELVEEIAKVVNPADIVVFSDVYYAGGTVDKSISSADIINDLGKKMKKERVQLVAQRDKFFEYTLPILQKGDVILMMGARDPSLAAFARDYLEKLQAS